MQQEQLNYSQMKRNFSIKKLAVIGQQKINQANQISQSGLNYFNNKMYVEAAIEFEKASKIDNLEYAHFENAASAYYMAGDLGKALSLSDIVINKLNPRTGKSEYINALAHISIGVYLEHVNFFKLLLIMVIIRHRLLTIKDVRIINYKYFTPMVHKIAIIGLDMLGYH